MKNQKTDLDRRSLLKAITMGTAAGAAIAATGVSAAQNSASTDAKSIKAGYQETDHVRRYYESLRG